MFFIIYEKEVSVVPLVVVTMSVLVIQLKLNLHSEKIRGFFFYSILAFYGWVFWGSY